MNEIKYAEILRKSCKIQLREKVKVISAAHQDQINTIVNLLQIQYQKTIQELMDQLTEFKRKCHILENSNQKQSRLLADYQASDIQQREYNQMQVINQLLNNKIKKLIQILKDSNLFTDEQLEQLQNEQVIEKDLLKIKKAEYAEQLSRNHQQNNCKHTQTEINQKYFLEQEQQNKDLLQLQEKLNLLQQENEQLQTQIKSCNSKIQNLKKNQCQRQKNISNQPHPQRVIEYRENTKEIFKFIKFDDLIYKNLGGKYEKVDNFNVSKSLNLNSTSRRRPATSVPYSNRQQSQRCPTSSTWHQII